jgi:hypothetical protein
MIKLPDIAILKARSQSLAMLDAILCPEWEGRYFSYNAHWAPGEQMASMRDGQGSGYFLLFTQEGAIIKGFAVGSPMSPFRRDPPRLWPGVLESVPSAFARFLREPAFVLEETTFCLWRQATNSTWKQGAIDFPSAQDPDGSQELLSLLCGEPHAYQSWAQDYYECEIPLAAVEAIFEHRTLTKRLLQQLNPDIALADLSGDLQEIAYSILPR